ncbi:MAG TPA: hypothetical protein VE911_09590 [Candidatus Nitrosopolaris sp.]|nr:hypothetical protein [Candidatus Nitrosopolaris sp.]
MSRPMPDGEELDRPALAGCPHRLEARQRRELARQGAGARPELLEGQELVQVRNPGEKPGQIEPGVDGSSLPGHAPHHDSSFDE